MAMPTADILWATSDINDPITGFPNKIIPPVQFMNSGLILSHSSEVPNEMLGSNFFNYQMDLIGKWQAFLRDRKAVNDIVGMVATGQAAALGVRYGGTWAEKVTTDVLAGQTVYWYERTA